MTVVDETLTNKVHHNGHIAKVEMRDYDAGYSVIVDDKKIGEYVFSDGHDGGAGFSNSFGVDCYSFTEICGKNAWLTGPAFFSRRNIVKAIIDKAIENGAI